MVLNNKYVFLLVALIAANLIIAQESSGDAENPPPESDQEEGGPGQGRTFFYRHVKCNYTAQAGNTCANCRQVLHCSFYNVGKLKTCKGLFRYCNNGHCSRFESSACNGTSSG